MTEGSRVMEWMPIETHRRGFSPVMLGCVASNGLAGMRCSGFLDATGVWRVLYSEGGSRKLPFAPTHWAPLPPPPYRRRMMHKDLSDDWRDWLETQAMLLAVSAFHEGQSLAIAREAWLAAFDKAAEELDSDGTK